MRIRESLVSNSSSTSFMVLHGNDFSVHELIDKYSVRNFPENKYYVRGKELGDGIDFFPMTREMFKLVHRDIGKINDLYVREVYLMKRSYGEFSKNEFTDAFSSLPEKFTMSMIDVDYHTTNKIDDFASRYVYNE